MHNWEKYIIYSVFIVGPNYISVVSYYWSFIHVMEQLLSYVEDKGYSTTPFVLLTESTKTQTDVDFMIQNNLITLVLD